MGPQYDVQQRHADAPAPALETPAPMASTFDRAPVALPGLAVRRTLRRSASDPLGGSEVDGDVQRQLDRPSGGRALDPATRGPMEQAFGADFGGVRVHTGSSAARLSRSLQANAFTHGKDIYFSQGAYDPGSSRGQHLLAHELTHVVQRQQGRDVVRASRAGGAAGPGTVVGRADDPLEAEAEATASTVVGALRRQTKDCTCGMDHS